MVRGTLERVLGADRLDAWFAQTAQKQCTRTLWFSTMYDMLSQVVFRIKPSVRAAYQEHAETLGASLISIYNKLNGVGPSTSATLVRYSATKFQPLITPLDVTGWVLLQKLSAEESIRSTNADAIRPNSCVMTRFCARISPFAMPSIWPFRILLGIASSLFSLCACSGAWWRHARSLS